MHQKRRLFGTGQKGEDSGVKRAVSVSLKYRLDHRGTAYISGWCATPALPPSPSSGSVGIRQLISVDVVGC